MAKKGLWYYMNKRRKEGKPKRKPGEKGYPGPGAFDRAKSEDAKDNLLGTPELTNKYKKDTPGQENINVPIKVGDTVEVRRGSSFRMRDAKIENIQIACTDDYDASVMQVDLNKIPDGTITYEDVTFENAEGNMHWARFNQIQK